MSAPVQRLPFEASAHLQTLIGRELFRTEEFAIVELIKNSYDSGATRVIVTIRPQSDREPGEVEIRDNGTGMGLAEFQRLFMVAGYSEKAQVPTDSRRIPTGEKGIGRFASDRIGRNLLVLTKKKNSSKGATLDINWDDFESRKKRFNEVTAGYREDSIQLFERNESGTILRISRLRSVWTNKRVEVLRSTLSQLLDPFIPPRDFEIDIQVPGKERLSGVVLPLEIPSADVELQLRVLKDGKVRRTLTGNKIPSSKQVEFHVEEENLRGLQARFFYFLPKGSISRRPTKLPPGVRLFRDGFRVEPFGPNNPDWLGVSEHKARRAGHAHIAPRRLFGVVSISRRTHSEIRDTTSREALLDTQAATDLVVFLKRQLGDLEDVIREDFTEPNWEVNRAREEFERTAEFETAKLQTLGIMATGVAHDLRQPLQTIRLQAENIRRRLAQLGIEDHLVTSSQAAIDRSVGRIDKRIRLFASISAGSSQDDQEIDLAALLKETCEELQSSCEQNDVELYVKSPDTLPAFLNATLVVAVITIIINNAVEAFTEVTDDRERQIHVHLWLGEKGPAVEIRDNANGIPEDVQKNIFQRFTSQKASGMGVGLHISRSIMRARGGDIAFTTHPGKGTIFLVSLPASGEA